MGVLTTMKEKTHTRKNNFEASYKKSESWRSTNEAHFASLGKTNKVMNKTGLDLLFKIRGKK